MRTKLVERRQMPSIEAAREFLQYEIHDADFEVLRKSIIHMMQTNPWPVLSGLNGIEGLLANPPEEEGVLANLVAWDANWVLDDPSDEGAKKWLCEMAEFIREVMGDKAPPRSAAISS